MGHVGKLGTHSMSLHRGEIVGADIDAARPLSRLHCDCRLRMRRSMNMRHTILHPVIVRRHVDVVVDRLYTYRARPPSSRRLQLPAVKFGPSQARPGSPIRARSVFTAAFHRALASHSSARARQDGARAVPRCPRVRTLTLYHLPVPAQGSARGRAWGGTRGIACSKSNACQLG